MLRGFLAAAVALALMAEEAAAQAPSFTACPSNIQASTDSAHPPGTAAPAAHAPVPRHSHCCACATPARRAEGPRG